jgi:hypothetical protein
MASFSGRVVVPVDVQGVISQIDQAVSEFGRLKARSKYDDYSDQPDEDVARVCARLASALARLTPAGSYQRQNFEKIDAGNGEAWKLARFVGVLLALKEEYELGYIQSFTELVHADTAASVMEMAEELHRQGYKDAAAVIVGSLLEQHLRDLCTKSQIPIEANGKRKKADTLNAELAGKAVYSKLEQKNVTAWLGLRNEAAHGNYTAYGPDQVALLIQSIEAFMGRFSA